GIASLMDSEVCNKSEAKFQYLIRLYDERRTPPVNQRPLLYCDLFSPHGCEHARAWPCLFQSLDEWKCLGLFAMDHSDILDATGQSLYVGKQFAFIGVA